MFYLGRKTEDFLGKGFYFCAFCTSENPKAMSLLSSLSWVEFCVSPPSPPKKRYVDILAPRTSELDQACTQGLYRGHQVKIRALGWALMSLFNNNAYLMITGVLLKRAVSAQR